MERYYGLPLYALKSPASGRPIEKGIDIVL